MANKITNTQNYQDIADAIRKKGGSGTYKPGDMAQAIVDLPSAQNEELLALLAGTGSGDMIVRGVTDISACPIQFASNPLDNVNVTSLEFPDLINARNNGGTIHGGFLCYAYATNRLRALKLPKCDQLYIHNTASNNFGNSFTELETLEAPVLGIIEGGLRGAKVSKLVFPMLRTSVCEYMNCTSLRYADLGKILSLGGQYGFSGCTSFAALVLRGDSVTTLNTTNKLANTLIAGGTGYIYVPRDLISSYEAATNWSTYAGQFRALEDYTDDGTIDGEFIMPA